MARAELVLSLVKVKDSRRGDDPKVRKVLEALAAEQHANNHTVFADRLLAQIRNHGNGQFEKSASSLNGSLLVLSWKMDAPHRGGGNGA